MKRRRSNRVRLTPILLLAFVVVACRRREVVVTAEPLSTEVVADAGAPPSEAAAIDDAESDAADAVDEASGEGQVVIHAPRLVRESAMVRVRGNDERWSIVWRTLPEPYCFGDSSCLCELYRYGEIGDADLVRVRADGTSDVFPLGSSTFPRWEKDASDPYEGADPDEVQKRPEVKLLSFADYDHDGEPDLPIRVDYLSCGHDETEVFGVDAATDRLRPIALAEKPTEPLGLESDEWPVLLGLAKGVHGTYPALRCGDHGSEEFLERALWWDAKGIHGEMRVYACTAALKKGALLKVEPL